MKRKFRFSICDRLDLAICQLDMVKERTGQITQGNVRRAAADWSDDGSPRQYEMLRESLMGMVTA